MSVKNDINVGKRFGTLVIKARIYGHKRARYECLCDCGNLKSIRKDHLFAGKINSCGCKSVQLMVNKTRGRISRLLRPDNHAAKTKIYYRYRGTAIEHNWEFNVSLEDFIKVAQSNCDYCNKASDKLSKVNGSSSQIMYTGVDRKDSSRGYTLDNITPCCTQCNMIKNNLLSYDEMKAAMNLILKMRNK